MCLHTCVNMWHFGLQSAEGGGECVEGQTMDDKRKVQNLFNLKPLLGPGSDGCVIHVAGVTVL